MNYLPTKRFERLSSWVSKRKDTKALPFRRSILDFLAKQPKEFKNAFKWGKFMACQWLSEIEAGQGRLLCLPCFLLLIVVFIGYSVFFSSAFTIFLVCDPQEKL